MRYSHRVEQVHKPRNQNKMRNNVHVVPVKSRTFQQVFGRGLLCVTVGTRRKIFLPFIEREALDVSPCKPTIGDLDDSINLDWKGTTWSLPIITGVSRRNYP
ncbi:hypothetical protein CDAR_454201 [Caerostris darwini]|uniref:Uncharacterized protein n=1 Tax=Caerostris darwini TaxID=1538125 RepID=A0AAV4V701_9ARAC|nr:hypothetical protein CDAR_454201 [Caerostris darwini]